MADLKISPNEIRDALKGFVNSYEADKASRTEVGHVIDAGDGIAHVEGLPGAMANELLKFADGTLGLALNLDEREIGTVVLGNFEGIEEGMEVHRTGEVLSVPVGDNFLGRVVDPLGNPIDGQGEIKAEGRRARKQNHKQPEPHKKGRCCHPADERTKFHPSWQTRKSKKPSLAGNAFARPRRTPVKPRTISLPA